MTLIEHLIEFGIAVISVIGISAIGIGILIAIEEWDTIIMKLKAANPFHTAGPSPEKVQPVDTDDKIYAKVGDEGIVDSNSRPETPDLHADIKDHDSTPNVPPDDTHVETQDYGLSEVRAEEVLLEPDGTFQIQCGVFTVGHGQIQTDEISSEQLRAVMEHAGVHSIELTAPRQAYNFDDNAINAI
jgi:hypothetical protein